MRLIVWLASESLKAARWPMFEVVVEVIVDVEVVRVLYECCKSVMVIRGRCAAQLKRKSPPPPLRTDGSMVLPHRYFSPLSFARESFYY
jgi:hypothetical protein